MGSLSLGFALGVVTSIVLGGVAAAAVMLVAYRTPPWDECESCGRLRKSPRTRV